MKFNINSPVFQFANTFAEFVILNVVFLITCIPVITIGAAVTALYSVVLQEAKGEGSYMLRSYWKAFGENFKKSTMIFCFYLISGAILLFNLVFWLHMESFLGNLFLAVISLLSLLWLISLLYVFPLQARFENRVSRTLKNALLIALSNRLWTAALTLIFVLALILSVYASVFRVFLSVFGFAFLAYCCSFLLLRVFGKYEEA